MENQGNFDFAILGDGLNALTTALLLGRQGERVIVLPESIQRPRQSRLLFGYENAGLIQGLLKRWGVPDDWLGQNVIEHPRIELVSRDLTLSLRDSLDRRALGTLAFELRGNEGARFIAALSELEKDPAWLDRFHADLLEAMQESQKGWRRFLQPSRNTSRLWAKTLRRSLRQRVGSAHLRALKVWARESDRMPEEIRLLLQGTGSLMGPGRSGIASLGNPLLQVLIELYAVRRTPLVRGKGEALLKQFRAFLKHQGISFVEGREKVQLKRSDSGRWEAFYGDTQKGGLNHFSMDHLVFAHSISERSLEFFEEGAKKVIENELRDEPSIHIEWVGKVPSSSLAFSERSEVILSYPEFPPIQISVYGAEDGLGLEEGESILQARTTLPDPTRLPADETQLRVRFERVLNDAFPFLDSVKTNDVRFRIERHRDFSMHSGVKTRNPRIFHVNHTSYPYLGEFGPFVAGIDLARRFARRRKRELRL